MSKRTMVLFTVLLICGFLLSMPAKAGVVAPTTAIISVSVSQDDGLTPVSGLTATVYDAADNDLTSTLILDNSITGTFTFSNITVKGNYHITLTKGSDKLTIPISITAFKIDPYKVKAVWVNKNTMSKSKSGVISDITLKDDGAALPGVTVKAYNAKGTWETVSDINGIYRIYLPVGSYTLVTVGKDSGGVDYKNIYTNVTVYGGQKTGSMVDQEAEAAWRTGEEKLGYQSLSLSSNSKIVTGVANVGCSATAYTVDSITGKYQFLSSSAKILPAKRGDLTGKFSITLPDYQPGKAISIKITDPALNMYEDKTYVTSPLANRTMTLTATTPSAVSGTINTPVVISFKDTNAPAMTSFLGSSINSVTVQHIGDPAIPLVKDTDYKITSGKITIVKGKISVAQDYVITVKANGYDDGTVIQTVAPSKLAAGVINGTFTVAAGSAYGTTKFISIGTAGTGNSLIYEIAQPGFTAQCRDNVLTGTSAPLVKDTDIGGVDVTTNSCIDVYEIDASSRIVNYKRMQLNVVTIKTPTLLSAVANGSTLTLTSDITLDTNSKPNNGVFPVKVNGVIRTVDNIALSGTNIILTLHSSLKSTDTVTVAYNKPSTNFLQDSQGNFIPSKAAMAVANNTPPLVPVSGITVTGAGSATAITTNGGTLQMSAAILPLSATNQSCTWSVVPGTGSAVISPTGLLTASGNGTVTVRAAANDGSGITGSLVITISNQIVPVSSISVTGAGNAITITNDGGTLQMSAAVLPNNATDQTVTWSVIPGTGSATISPTGVLTAVSNGTVTVRADANDSSGIYGTLDITLSNQAVPVSGITVTGAGNTTTIDVRGGTLQMSALISPADATYQTCNWSVVPGTGAATIDSNGLLTAVSNGTVTVSAAARDSSGVTGTLIITISNQ